MELSLSDNKKFLVIDSCTELEYEQLKSSLTKKIEGWRFHPLVKKRVWDGNISFIKRNKIPAGLWKEVIDICKQYDFQFTLNHITNIFDTELVEEDFKLWVDDFFAKSDIKPRDYQIDAAYKILKYRRCLAELATSAGKTLISFMVVAYMMEKLGKKKILMIVPNVSLVVQATGDFEQYNKSRVPLRIQQIYAGMKIRKSSNIVIGTYQSLTKKDEEYFSQFDAVFVDETHKAKANSIQKIMDKCWHCDYRFGLSGTIPKRGTVNRLSLMSAMGPLVTQVKAAHLQDEGYIAQCKVLQIHMEYASESQKEAFSTLSKNPYDRQRLFGLEQNFINESDKRLDFVCKVIKKSTSNSLVLFHKIAYGEKLYQRLREITDKKIYYVDGSVSADIREEFKSRMEKNDDVIIVASYGTFSTGISIKNIHNIFFTESFKSEVIIRQSIGRGLRKHHAKSVVKIYDFIDDFRYKTDDHDWLNYIYRHGMARRKIYKEEKFPFEVQNIRF
jgi:superfamily II DNA or RNA helicase|tara:strand:- start:833 stop:2335 length:1503 start_codon:yes stop_codon:yes gene_type:complete